MPYKRCGETGPNARAMPNNGLRMMSSRNPISLKTCALSVGVAILADDPAPIQSTRPSKDKFQLSRRALTKKKPRPRRARLLHFELCGNLTLTGFEPALGLVDNVDPAFTANNAAIAVAVLKRPEGVANFHGSILCLAAQ